MTHEAVLSFEYSSAERADRVERSVRPEIGDIEGERTTASIDRDGTAVTVTIEAKDLVALRAGLNTWQSMVGVAARVDAPPQQADG